MVVSARDSGNNINDRVDGMALYGLLPRGVLVKGSFVSMGALCCSSGTFLVKLPDQGVAPHLLSHYKQPSMMKIVLRQYVRWRLLPMLDGISDMQCTF